jgi:hypothetical protein
VELEGALQLGQVVIPAPGAVHLHAPAGVHVVDERQPGEIVLLREREQRRDLVSVRTMTEVQLLAEPTDAEPSLQRRQLVPAPTLVVGNYAKGGGGLRALECDIRDDSE